MQRSESKEESFENSSRIDHIASLLTHLHPGDLADLRRCLDVEMPGSAFWKIMVTLPAFDQDQRISQWQLLLTCLAYMKGLHTPKLPFGKALALKQYSEARFTKLLKAKPTSSRSEIIAAVRFLSAKGQEADLNQLASLILNNDKEGIQIRRRLAKDFYSN